MKYLFEFLIKLNLILGVIYTPYTYASDDEDLSYEHKEFNIRFKKSAKRDSDFIIGFYPESDEDYIIPKLSRKRKREKTTKDRNSSFIRDDKMEKNKKNKNKKLVNLVTSSDFSSDYTLTVTKESKSVQSKNSFVSHKHVVKTVKPAKKKQRTQEKSKEVNKDFSKSVVTMDQPIFSIPQEGIEHTIPIEAILAVLVEEDPDEQKLTSAVSDTLPEIVIDVEEDSIASPPSENDFSMPTPQNSESPISIQEPNEMGNTTPSEPFISSTVKSKTNTNLYPNVTTPYSNGMQASNFWPAFYGGSTYTYGMYQYGPYPFMAPTNQGDFYNSYFTPPFQQ